MYKIFRNLENIREKKNQLRTEAYNWNMENRKPNTAAAK